MTASAEKSFTCGDSCERMYTLVNHMCLACRITGGTWPTLALHSVRHKSHLAAQEHNALPQQQAKRVARHVLRPAAVTAGIYLSYECPLD